MTASLHQSSTRLRSIDFLRGLAALAVAFGHAVIAAPYTDVAGEWFTALCLFVKWLTATGVPLFFVISGFCIHLGQARHEGLDRFRFGAFWKRRLWRLYPTYLVVLAGSIGLLVLMQATGTGAETLARYPEPRNAWLAADAVVHALMLHGLHPFFDQGAGNPPFWTLAREEYLYLMYPLILLLRGRMAWWVVALLLAAMTVSIELAAPALTTSSAWIALLVSSSPALWIQWHLGSVAADAYRGTIALPAVFFRIWYVPAWLALAYVAPFPTLWLALAYFTLVNACVRREAAHGWPTAGLAAWLAAVGVWSYSLYLIHHPVQTIALAISLRIGSVDGATLFLARALILTAASCIAAKVLFVLVERHFVSPAAFDRGTQRMASARAARST